MTWTSTFNGFLFVALAFAWNKSCSLVFVIAFLGIAVSLFSGVSLLFANKAFRKLYWEWEEDKKPDDYDGPGVIGLPPRYKKGPKTWLNPWSSVPFCFVLAWFIIFVIRLIS
jgi:hypothetical protein